jgi:hypothetical protein
MSVATIADDASIVTEQRLPTTAEVRASQGLSPGVTDPVTLRALAHLLDVESTPMTTPRRGRTTRATRRTRTS